ncbi:MAG TPA: hypothetical protein PLO62_05440 [Candidatus Hydrogenedentes bacterium]|nr:hypothetical protein [Candidatus Hydrogenedentota bacterium]HOS01722.1 hypothetical protein [Candidatus Hydrogenedentota bacterium]
MIDRITILGGSSVYVPEFILSLISHNLCVKEIVLTGRTERKLALVSSFCQRLVDRSGLPVKIVGTTDITQAISGAKYIINQIRVGGMQARLRDEKIPPKLGMLGDESLGAGGFANAMRTLPVLFDLNTVIEAFNPNAILINLTNPLGVVVEALTKYSKLTVVGVCDLPAILIKRLSALLRRDPRDLTIDYLGLNHMGWVQDIRMDGRSCMSRLLERIETVEDDGVDRALIQLFRMIPTRTVSLFFHQDQILKRQQECGRFRAEVLYEAERQILKLYEDKNLAEVPDLTRARNAVWYEETIVPLIKAFEDKTEREFVLCVRNDGAIRDLPDNCSVEIPVKVCKGGMRPRKMGNCPRLLRGLFLSLKESDHMTVEAVRHKSYDYALQALTINPLVSSLDGAKRFLDRIIKDEQLDLH